VTVVLLAVELIIHDLHGYRPKPHRSIAIVHEHVRAEMRLVAPRVICEIAVNDLNAEPASGTGTYGVQKDRCEQQSPGTEKHQ